MEDLEDCRVREKRLEARRRPVLAVELDEMSGAVPGAELHEAEPVAVRLEPEGLGVHSDGPLEDNALGQIVPVQLYDGAHGSLVSRLCRPGKALVPNSISLELPPGKLIL